jgi:hypothetical protein
MKKTKQTYQQVNQYDKIIKENFKAVMPSLINNILNINVVTQESIPTKLQHTKEREADFLKVITDTENAKFILHIEFQLAKDAKMRFRMLEYYLMLRMIYPDLQILQYVIFIGDVPNHFENEIKEKKLYFTFDVVNIREITYQHFLKSNVPEEIIFSILANFGNENTDKVVETIIRSIKDNSKTQLQQQKCFQQLRILSNLRNFVPLIEQIMESIALYIKEENDPLFQKGQHLGIEKGIEKGIEQGIEQGIEKGVDLKAYEVVVSILEKFPIWEDDVIADLSKTDIAFVQKIRQELIEKANE